jgi:hypothetical protein
VGHFEQRVIRIACMVSEKTPNFNGLVDFNAVNYFQ